MNRSNIHQLHRIKQDTKEGIFTMTGYAFTKLIHSLIREYGSYHDGSYGVDISTLSLSDKKLLISHIADSEEYEWACATPTRTEAVFLEYFDRLQGLIDDECYSVYCEDMEEMGMRKCNHADNNEVYWVRR
jgi:hypothetical protein